MARAACRRASWGLSPAQVEELVQETLAIVWQRRDKLGADASFEAWVSQIARNVCRNEVRKKRELLTEDGVLEAADPAHCVLPSFQREERQALLCAAMETALNRVEQDVVCHRYFRELEREEIAELLGLRDAEHVRKVLFTAMRRLRRELLRRLEALGGGPSLLYAEEG
jgi:RNA polymerase sigma factor (sigma-70 family)